MPVVVPQPLQSGQERSIPEVSKSQLFSEFQTWNQTKNGRPNVSDILY